MDDADRFGRARAGPRVGALCRLHARPSPGKLVGLAAILEEFGIELKGAFEDLPPRSLQRVLAQVEGRPEERLVHALTLRALARAGLVVAAGLNTVAVLEEAGVRTRLQAAAVLHPSEDLLRPAELDRRVATSRRLHQRLAALMDNPTVDREYTHEE